MRGVSSFFKSHDINLPKMQRGKKNETALKENLKISTTEDMREALSVCDPLEKAIVLVGCASGLSRYEIRHLRIRDFKNTDAKTKLTKLELRREKEQVDFITLLTPEAKEAVNDYLAYRMRESKTARKEALEKQVILNDYGYLFIKRNIPDKWLKTHDEELRKISTESFVRIYRDIAEKCKKLAPKGKMNLIRSHNMRRYFHSALLKRRMR
jgi:hypothetical protein